MDVFLWVAVIWLWAGYWMARPSMQEINKQPLWARIVAAILAMMLWPILFPVWQIIRERHLKRIETLKKNPYHGVWPPLKAELEKKDERK